MTILAPAAHRALDYATVLLFALSPTLFQLTGPEATICYALAVVHALMTMVTHFPGGRGFLPFRAHMFVEILVGCALIGLGFVRFSDHMTFWGLMGALILAVVLMSFGGAPRTAPQP